MPLPPPPLRRACGRSVGRDALIAPQKREMKGYPLPKQNNEQNAFRNFRKAFFV